MTIAAPSQVIVEPISRETWNEAVHTFADHNYRHVWEYGEIIASRNGAASEHVAVRRDGQIIALADVRVKSIPVVGGGVAYIGGGPLTRRNDAPDIATLQDALGALAAEYVERRGYTLRVMCPLGCEAWNAGAQQTLTDLGFTAARWPKPYRTIAINTARSLEKIRDSFSKNWRKNLRRGEERGVTIRVSRDHAAFDSVIALYDELLDRKGFDVELDARFYAAANEAMSTDQRFTVILAEHDGAVCGMNVVSALGDTMVGIIGATTYEGAKRYAAYLLEWAAMELAHHSGQVRYDMGGIDPDDNPGGYDFKRGTRGDDLTGAGPAECKPAGFRAAVAEHGERVYRAIRRAAKNRAAGAVSMNGESQQGESA